MNRGRVAGFAVGIAAIALVVTVVFFRVAQVRKSGDGDATSTVVVTPIVKDRDGNFLVYYPRTGESRPFFPRGYILPHVYPPLAPDAAYVLLAKENRLHLFDVTAGALREIPESTVSEGEGWSVLPSFSEPDKFFVTIGRVEEDAFQGEYLVLLRSYHYDARTNEWMPATFQPPAGDCSEYDSKHRRFFTWPCGEGIGSSAPLSVVSVDGSARREVISLADFSSASVGAVGVLRGGNTFFAMDKDPRGQTKIILASAANPEIKLQTLQFTDAARSQFTRSGGSYPFSAAWVERERVLIIGSDDVIHLLDVSPGNRIAHVTTIPERAVYANNLYVFGNKLYYPVPEKRVHVVDLRRKAFEGEFVYGAYGQDEFVTMYSERRR